MKWPRELLRTSPSTKWHWQRRSVGVRRPRCHMLAHRRWHTSFSAPCRKSLPSGRPCYSVSTTYHLCHCIPGQAPLLRKSITAEARFGVTLVFCKSDPASLMWTLCLFLCYATSAWVLHAHGQERMASWCGSGVAEDTTVVCYKGKRQWCI